MTEQNYDTGFWVSKDIDWAKIRFEMENFTSGTQPRCITCGQFISAKGKQHLCFNMWTLDEVRKWHGHEDMPDDAWVCETCYGSGTHHPAHDPLAPEECPDCNGDGYR